ncbi:hypothetical protein FKM82_026168 [Ascaphus truei]
MEEQEDLQRAAAEGKPSKERPIWLRESTVQGVFNETAEHKEGGLDADPFQEHEESRPLTDENEEVMQALLIHEKKSAAGGVGASPAPASNAVAGSDSDSDTSESDQDSPAPQPPVKAYSCLYAEDDEDEDEFEEVTADHTVTVGGRQYPYSEVSQRPELVAQMTPQEKDAYIVKGRKMFEEMYD